MAHQSILSDCVTCLPACLPAKHLIERTNERLFESTKIYIQSLVNLGVRTFEWGEGGKGVSHSNMKVNVLL